MKKVLLIVVGVLAAIIVLFYLGLLITAWL